MTQKDRTATPPAIVCAYSYRDEAGKVLYQCVRFAPKQFRQRRPGRRDGEWLWDLSGCRLVLYRLPELLAADPSRVVFVVEGERSADRLADQLGLVATTNVMGAGKWRPEYTASLKGRRVVVLPDHDRVSPKTGRRAGWEHARLVANQLSGHAAGVKVVSLPVAEGQDVDDWLDSFGGEAQPRQVLSRLAELVDAEKDWVPQPDTHLQVPTFTRGALANLRAYRERKPPVADAAGALGILRMVYLRVEERLRAVSGGSGHAALNSDLMHMAAAAQMVAEDLQLVPDLRPEQPPPPDAATTAAGGNGRHDAQDGPGRTNGRHDAPAAALPS